MKQGEDTKETVVHILDTGSSVYAELHQKWLRSSDGFIITYSITNRNGFNDIPKIIEEISSCRKNKITPIIIIGTYCKITFLFIFLKFFLKTRFTIIKWIKRQNERFLKRREWNWQPSIVVNFLKYPH